MNIESNGRQFTVHPPTIHRTTSNGINCGLEFRIPNLTEGFSLHIRMVEETISQIEYIMLCSFLRNIAVNRLKWSWTVEMSCFRWMKPSVLYYNSCFTIFKLRFEQLLIYFVRIFVCDTWHHPANDIKVFAPETHIAFCSPQLLCSFYCHFKTFSHNSTWRRQSCRFYIHFRLLTRVHIGKMKNKKKMIIVLHRIYYSRLVTDETHVNAIQLYYHFARWLYCAVFVLIFHQCEHSLEYN